MIAHLHELALVCTPASETALDAGQALQDESQNQAGRQAGSLFLLLHAVGLVGWLKGSDLCPFDVFS